MSLVTRIRHKKGGFWVVDQKPPYTKFNTYEEAVASVLGVVKPEVVVIEPEVVSFYEETSPESE